MGRSLTFIMLNICLFHFYWIIFTITSHVCPYSMWVMAVKVLSYNVNGWNSPFRSSMFWRDAIKSKADVLCFQETQLQVGDVEHLKHRKFPHVFHTVSPLSRGCNFSSVTFQLINSDIDPTGRSIILNYTITSVAYTILSLYAPNGHHVSFIGKTIAKAKKVALGGLLVGGDFNAVACRDVDGSLGPFCKHGNTWRSLT